MPRLDKIFADRDMRGEQALQFLSPYDRILYYNFSGHPRIAKRELLKFCRDYNYRFFRPEVTYEQIFKRLSGRKPDVEKAHFLQFLKEDLGEMLEFYKREHPEAGKGTYAFLFKVLKERDVKKRIKLWNDNKELVHRFVESNLNILFSQLSLRTINRGVRFLSPVQPKLMLSFSGMFICVALVHRTNMVEMYPASLFVIMISIAALGFMGEMEAHVGLPRQIVKELEELYK